MISLFHRRSFQIWATSSKPELVGQRIGQASFCITTDDLAEIFSKVPDKKIKYNCVPWNVFAEFGFPGANELAQMFEFWLRTHKEFVEARDLDKQKKIMGEKISFTDPVAYARTLPLQFKE